MRDSMAAKRRASARLSAALAWLARCIHPRSAPALKCLPCAASTTTRTCGFAPKAAKAASSASIICSSKAFDTAGRATSTQATPLLRSSTRTLENESLMLKTPN